MAESKEQRERQPESQPPLRHKSEGHGTHGTPQERPTSEPDRPLPEGNGATDQPAAFPEHP